MSEMLGNRYFISRQYDLAVDHLEKALSEDSQADKIRKKLIICYIQTGHVDRALDYFYLIIRKDPFIIIDTDAYHDDCPCIDLIPLWEAHLKEEGPSYQLMLILGILSLYCDLHISIEYLKKAATFGERTALITSILKRLTEVENSSNQNRASKFS